MGYVKTKFEDVGLVLQPRTLGTFDLPVGDGATDLQWTNPADNLDQFYPIHGMPGTWNFNRNANVNNTLTTSSKTNNPVLTKIVSNTAGVVPSIDGQAYANTTTLVAFLLASLQEVAATEPGTGVFKYIFTPNGSVLDFTNDQGYLFTLLGRNWGQQDAYLLTNALLNTLSISMQNNASGSDRIMQMTGQWMGNLLETNQLSEEWTTPLADDLIGSINTVSEGFTLGLTSTALGGAVTPVCWKSFTFENSNGVNSDCFSGIGAPNNFKRTTDGGMLTITIPYTDVYYALIAMYATKQNMAVSFKNAYAATAVGHIDFNIANSILTSEPRVVDGEYFGIELKLQLLTDETNLDNNTITVVSAADYTDGF